MFVKHTILYTNRFFQVQKTNYTRLFTWYIYAYISILNDTEKYVHRYSTINM